MKHLLLMLLFTAMAVCVAGIDQRRTSLRLSESERSRHIAPKAVSPLDECGESYFPCDCAYNRFDGYTVTCYVKSANDFVEIYKAFNRTLVQEYYEVRLSFQSSTNISVPSNILAGKRSKYVDFICAIGEPNALGPIAADALNSNANLLYEVTIESCTLINYNFEFLKPLTSIYRLLLQYSTVNSLQTLPLLPSLGDISVIYTKAGLQNWYPPAQTPNLKSFNIYGSQAVNDSTIDSVLKWYSGFSGKSFVTKVDLSSNSLTRVPPALAVAFPQLSYFSLAGNPITVLPTGSLDITVNGTDYPSIWLNGMKLKEIQKGAFKSNFSSVRFDLIGNQVTTLSSDAFQDLLRGMVNSTGSMDIRGNPIVYDCNLAWLLVHNRGLMAKLQAEIANGTDFKLLDQRDLASRCP